MNLMTCAQLVFITIKFLLLYFYMYIRVIFIFSLNYRYILQTSSLIIHVLYVAQYIAQHICVWMRRLIDIGTARREITRKRVMIQQCPVWVCSRIASITSWLTINNYPISLMICRNAFWPVELRPMATFPSFSHPLSALCHSGGIANLSLFLSPPFPTLLAYDCIR